MVFSHQKKNKKKRSVSESKAPTPTL
uniref:Uncharacterized protein n=1 Tax=Rhizophora mucronata TaxID=61149 RepID=A0A2P2NMY2_RHIMU